MSSSFDLSTLFSISTTSLNTSSESNLNPPSPQKLTHPMITRAKNIRKLVKKLNFYVTKQPKPFASNSLNLEPNSVSKSLVGPYWLLPCKKNMAPLSLKEHGLGTMNCC